MLAKLTHSLSIEIYIALLNSSGNHVT